MPVNSIDSMNALSPVSFSKTESSGEKAEGLNFSEFLNDALNKVNDMQLESDKLTDEFAAGKTDNIHQVLITAEKADIALQLTMQIRNKILDAYSEIMRMQI